MRGNLNAQEFVRIVKFGAKVDLSSDGNSHVRDKASKQALSVSSKGAIMQRGGVGAYG